MATARLPLASVLALLACLAAGCAARSAAATGGAAAPPSATRNEVAELEKTIADAKARLKDSDSGATGEPTDAAESAPTPMSTGAGAPSARCDGVCRAGQEICTASRRICRIAADVSDPTITASCQRAEHDCTDASALCSQCR